MGNKTKVGQVFQELCWQLGQILNMSPEDVSASSLFVTLIPPNERRRIWEELRQSGVALPELRLANPVLFLTALIILLPVTVWAILSKNGFAFLCLLELFWIAGKLTRPWAIFPPIGCETVQEAVLANTPFHQKDYHAGLGRRKISPQKSGGSFLNAWEFHSGILPTTPRLRTFVVEIGK